MALRPKGDTIKVRTPEPLTLAAVSPADEAWNRHVAIITTRALGHIRVMISTGPPALGEWQVELHVEEARTAPGVMVRFALRHACGARLTLTQLLSREGETPPAGVSEAIADALVKDALRKAESHTRTCRQPAGGPPSGAPSVWARPYPLENPKPSYKIKPPASCVLCGADDETFPVWEHDCSHTNKERRGK